MKTFKLLSVAAIVFTIAACSGGSGGSDTPDVLLPAPAPPPNAGITGTGIAAGPITGFGSIFVNGVRYETDDASFSINGQPGVQDDLSVGQFVVVKASLDQTTNVGTATEVIYNDDVKGPVESIDAASSVIVVLGQTVNLTANTSFDDSIPTASLGGLNVGDIVEVSGITMADGSISATRIELKPAGTEFEVLGLVSQLDSANSTFMINQLTVDFSSASLNDFPNGMIEDGQLVEAKGTMLNAQGQLVATEVELETNNLQGEEDEYLELEGFITRFVSLTDFDVSGVPVTTTASTVYTGGQSSDLGLNVKVEIEGNFNADGVVVAEEVDIRRGSAVRITAIIDSVSVNDSQIVALGIPVTIDERTRIEDKSDAELEPLTLADLNPGDYVEVRGSEEPAESGEVIAALLEREEADDETELQGFVTDFSDPVITVLGVTIDTTNAEFRDDNDMPLSRQEFFDQLSVGSLIKTDGTEIDPTTIMADEVEFEIED